MPEGAGQALKGPHTVTIGLSRSQFEKFVQLFSHRPEGAWRAWIKTIVMPVIVTAFGAVAVQQITEHYSQHQKVLAQAQAAEKYIEYFAEGHSHQQRYLALQSLVQIGNYDAAADLLATLPHNYERAKKALDPQKDNKNGDEAAEP